MKRVLLGAGVLALVVAAAAAFAQSAQPKPYKVVFDLTSGDALDQAAVLRWIKEVHGANPGTEMEVVMFGRGPGLVVSDKTTNAAGVAEAIKEAHAKFAVCAIAMKNQNIEKSRLLPGVEVVPDGIGELVAKQRAGWGYIKVGH